MKHICILVPRGAAALSTIEGSFIAFSRTNDFLERQGKSRLFEVELVGLDREPQVYDKLFKVTPDKSISEITRTDLIVVPAVNGEVDQVLKVNEAFFPWIVSQHQSGAQVASLCVGAYLLAATGLLKGKKCSTHWLAAQDFRGRFPETELVSGEIITDQQGVYTSGGANSFWNLLIYLIEKFTDREMAILCSKYFAIEIDRHSQSPFIIFKGQREHDDEGVRKAQEFIENNVADRISVEDLASKFAIGRRNFERRFKKATHNTPVEYIQRVKVEAAKKQLEGGRKNVTEVMYEVGYTDTKAFRTIVKRITGLSPLDYRNKYNKEAVGIG